MDSIPPGGGKARIIRSGGIKSSDISPRRAAYAAGGIAGIFASEV